MSARENRAEVERTMKALRQKIYFIELDFYRSIAENLIDHALENRGYKGFTGNTQTSYTVGVYVNGRLTYTFTSQDGQRRPIMHKLQKGKKLRLRFPYEGDYPKTRIGMVEVDTDYGSDSAVRTLKELERSEAVRNSKCCMCMTTGTEYSQYLEKVWDLNVLTATYDFTKVDVAPLLKRQLEIIGK